MVLSTPTLLLGAWLLLAPPTRAAARPLWPAAAPLPAEEVRGVVVNEEGEPLPGATVFVKGTYTGTSTNQHGEFLLPVSFAEGPVTLSVAFAGYGEVDVTLSGPDPDLRVQLYPLDAHISQRIMSAARIEQNIQLAPVTVDKVSTQEIGRTATPELMSGLARLKALDISSASMLFTTLSTRGFNTAKSERLVQLVDYADAQLPSLNLSPGNLTGLPELDLESVEISHGPASALYGANALSGVILFNSKDPFVYTGLSARVRGGQRGLLDAQLRYAHRLSPKLAFKVNASALRAEDWLARNYAAAATSANPAGSPLGYDPINAYGNYGYTFTPAQQLPGGTNRELYGQTVYTPGFTEASLVGPDRTTSSYRLQGGLSYLLRDNLKLTADARVVQATATYQNLSRFRVKDLRASQYRLELKSPRGFVRAYTTGDFANQSYELNQLGNLLQEAPVAEGSPVSYIQTYLATYNGIYSQLRNAGATPAAALAGAQQAANATQLRPDDPRFEQLRRQLIADDQPGRGARQHFRSRLYDVSTQYTLPISDFGSVLTAGAAYRAYRLGSGGKLFADTTGHALTNYEYGAYGQIIQNLLHDQLKLSVAARFDRFRNFGSAVAPRTAAVYSFGPDNRHNFRASYGQAYRSPSQIEQYVYEDLGFAVYSGNVQQGYRGYALTNEQGETLTPTSDLSRFVAQVPRLQLEQATTLEVGYRGSLLPNLYLDASYFRSRYHHFVAAQALVSNLDGSMPTPAQVAAGVPSLFTDRSLPTRIVFVYYNNARHVRTQGATVALSYAGWKAFAPAVNYSLNVLDRSDLPVGTPTYFNTPRHKFNLGASGTVGRLGYQLNYRWAQGHRQEMPFATGYVAAFSSTDALLSYQLPKLLTTAQVGVSNAFNANNVQIIGGPQIGRLAFAGLLFELQ